MTIKVINATSLRRNLADVLNQAVGGRRAILVRRRNRADVALVDADFLEDLLLLHDEEYQASIAEAREDARKGRLFSHQEIFGE
jgi:PHD/YefM family antitoxin component YafN of YafNO toxin-antitoxin module